LMEHDLFGKPVPAFPDHALERAENERPCLSAFYLYARPLPELGRRR
jgi:hypothetical protein